METMVLRRAVMRTRPLAGSWITEKSACRCVLFSHTGSMVGLDLRQQQPN